MKTVHLHCIPKLTEEADEQNYYANVWQLILGESTKPFLNFWNKILQNYIWGFKSVTVRNLNGHLKNIFMTNCITLLYNSFY